MRDNQGYVLFDKDAPIGILRYNLFWDNTPFCTLLFICEERQKQSCGRMLMEHWEEDMKRLGYQMVMTSTRIDEEAQHFYRKLGYIDCGNLTIDYPGLAYVLPEGFQTNCEGVEYCDNSEASYAVITVKDPMVQPFERIPVGYKHIMDYLEANNIKGGQDDNVVGCFEYEYEKDGIGYMDIYICVDV